ncbi:hypothetical protein [Anoxynatronum buryatiense]|uniref:YD repeat-containing protein n=1 Tax=Anoxynatronum buryatiense TaxID=489973 RepID=A0AA45WXN8_9CLOT|nr:hypothetical protein [Anoxynatronum buryatiense]SMP64999.1 YD repeat-containing protein [Anoxynatronum buryatiense]
MKKTFSLLALLLVLTLLVTACGTTGATEEPAPAEAPAEVEETVEEEVTEAPAGEAGEAVSMGLALLTSIGKSTDAEADKTARAQVDTVIAAATFDSEGRVVDVIIDNAQTRVNFDEELKVASDKTALVKTKVELGADYGMGNVSSIGKEWFEQIAEVEAWMVGKTIDEIKALPMNDGYPDLPEMASTVTMSVSTYLEAVEKAYANAVPVSNVASLGLGTEVSIAKSRDYAVDADGKETLPMAQVDSVISAVAFDAAGAVVGVQIDNAQTRVNYDAEGKVTSDKAAPVLSKVELGDSYGMGAVSAIGKNWYEQIAELEAWMIGKTVDEIKALPVKVVDDAHQSVPDVPELTSSVTITVESYLATVAEAYTNAR